MSFFWQMAFSQMQSSGRWLLKRIGGGGGASHGLTWPLMRSWPRRLCDKATFSTAHWHPRPVKALADVCALGAGCLSTCGGPLFEFFGAERSKFRTPAGRSICGWFQGLTFSGTKVNPWTHPQILRPAGVRNLDLSAPKSSKSGPPQQSLADVLRHFGSGEGSAERLRGFVAGVRFLSFSGLKGPNSGPPRVVVSVDDSRGSLWFRRRFRRTSARLCCGGPLFELFGAERSKFRTPAGRSICGWVQGFTLVPEKVPQNVCEALLRGSAFWAFRGWKVRAARSWRDYHDTLVH